MFWDTPLVDVKLVSFWLHLSKFNFNFYFLFRKLIKFGIIYVAYIWFLLSVLWILFFLLKFDLTIWILAFVLYFWKMFLHVDLRWMLLSIWSLSVNELAFLCTYFPGQEQSESKCKGVCSWGEVLKYLSRRGPLLVDVAQFPHCEGSIRRLNCKSSLLSLCYTYALPKFC